MHAILPHLCFLTVIAGSALAQVPCESDLLVTSAGKVKFTFIGHASLMLECAGKVIQIDPWGKLADYTRLPKADLILVTHEHFDHLDPAAIQTLQTTNTVVVMSASCADKVSGGVIMKNGVTRTVAGVKIEAVPAYNLIHKRDDGTPFHPKGVGNGYLLTIGEKRIYVAGDTENTPEMKALTNIDVAFLPMNLPYTMTPEMVADAARAFQPKILYPYHYGETDPQKLLDLMKDVAGVEVRVRKLR